jgi:hypothetical protein
MRSGWFQERYRHGLAARGIKTSYYADKTRSTRALAVFQNEKLEKSNVPMIAGDFVKRDYSQPSSPKQESSFQESGVSISEAIAGTTAKALKKKGQYEELRYEARLEEEARRQLEEGTPVAKTIRLIQEGRYEMIDPNVVKTFKPGETDAVVSAARAKAIQLAQTGLDTPSSIEVLLDGATKSRIKAIRETVRRTETPETAGQIERRELAKKFLVGVAETPGLAARKAVEISREQPVRTGDTQKQFMGITGTIDELSETPFFKTNALLDEPGLPGYNKEQGALNYPAGSSKDIPGLKGAFGFVKDPETTEKKIVDKVQLRVDSLHRAKGRLADADLSAYKKGTKAFEKGDRERLISSINELEAQGSRLKDNWGLVDQVHVQVVSPENNMSAHEESWSMLGSNGGEKLADQTKKVNDVREEIKDKFGQVKARSRLLQYRLQRLDSNVKPEHGAPREIARLAEERSGDNLVFGSGDVRIPISQAMPRKEDIRRYTPAWLRKGG